MPNLSPELSRFDWLRCLFPEGVPQLWCPPLTHYGASGQIDESRIAAHLRFISPWVRGVLVPGSTGDGWELSEAEADELLGIVLKLAPQLKYRVLIGALHPLSGAAGRLIRSRAQQFQPAGSEFNPAHLARAQVCGFAICPPRGANMAQTEIETELAAILELGQPIALYQLPQVTQNEMAPELVSRLAAKFANFILFKDTSGRDQVSQSGLDFQGVFLVRGMEGEYARWLKSAQGPYDGFLLASANCFARQLHTVQELLLSGNSAQAEALAGRVARVVSGAFDLVKSLPTGNMFANGGKALDHFFAHGPGAARVTPPRLHSGQQLPEEVIRGAGALLEKEGLMPSAGYVR